MDLAFAVADLAASTALERVEDISLYFFRPMAEFGGRNGVQSSLNLFDKCVSSIR